MKKYLIGGKQFVLRDLSLREDEKLAKIIDRVFGAQLDEANKQHQKNLKLKNADVPFIQTQFVNDSIIITGGFLSKLLETKAATVIADMILVRDSKLPLLTSCLWPLKSFRLYWLSKHIKGELKSKIFTDFFLDGTVYAASLVNHFLILLANRIAQMEELKLKSSG